MKNLLTAFALATVTVVVSNPAAAQAPPMDMSWGITINPQVPARNDAATLAMQYYNYMMQLRAKGYCCSSPPVWFNLRTAGEVGSDLDSNAAREYDLRAVRDCTKLTSGPLVYCVVNSNQ